MLTLESHFFGARPEHGKEGVVVVRLGHPVRSAEVGQGHRVPVRRFGRLQYLHQPDEATVDGMGRDAPDAVAGDRAGLPPGLTHFSAAQHVDEPNRRVEIGVDLVRFENRFSPHALTPNASRPTPHAPHASPAETRWLADPGQSAAGVVGPGSDVGGVEK